MTVLVRKHTLFILIPPNGLHEVVEKNSTEKIILYKTFKLCIILKRSKPQNPQPQNSKTDEGTVQLQSQGVEGCQLPVGRQTSK